MMPPYYPPLTRVNHTNINNYQIFDASSVVDWEWLTQLYYFIFLSISSFCSIIVKS